METVGAPPTPPVSIEQRSNRARVGCGCAELGDAGDGDPQRRVSARSNTGSCVMEFTAACAGRRQTSGRWLESANTRGNGESRGGGMFLWRCRCWEDTLSLEQRSKRAAAHALSIFRHMNLGKHRLRSRALALPRTNHATRRSGGRFISSEALIDMACGRHQPDQQPLRNRHSDRTLFNANGHHTDSSRHQYIVCGLPQRRGAPGAAI